MSAPWSVSALQVLCTSEFLAAETNWSTCVSCVTKCKNSAMTKTNYCYCNYGTFSQFHNKLNKYNTIYGYCWNVFIQLISCIASCLYIIIGSWRLRVAVMLEIECTQTCLWSKYTVLQNKSSLEDSESFITFPWDLSIAFQNKNRAEEFTEWFLLINQKIFNMGKMNGDFPSFDLNTVKRNWKKLVTAKVAHKPFPLFSLLSFFSHSLFLFPSLPNPTRLRLECLGDIVSEGEVCFLPPRKILLCDVRICSCCFCWILCSSSVHLRKISHVSRDTKEVLLRFFTSKCFWWLHA